MNSVLQFLKLLFVALVFMQTICARADNPVPPGVVKNITTTLVKNSQGSVQIQNIQRTPIQGLYQLEVDGEVMYVDESGRYALVGGALMDTQKRVDLTALHLEKRLSVNFSDLPLRLAIKQVHGDGSRKIALFEDPNCPICRVFTKFADQLPDVTIYRFMFPVVDPKSESLARIAWCSSDRAATWASIMAGARPRGREDCDTSGLVEILKIGDRLKIAATPTVFLGNGKRLIGATPPEQFMAELDASTLSTAIPGNNQRQ